MRYNQKDVVLCTLTGNGTEERGTRPCLIVSGDSHNIRFRSYVVIPLTKQLNKAEWNEHCMFTFPGNEKEASVAMCEHIREIDCNYVHHRIGTVGELSFNRIMNVLYENTFDLSRRY